MGKDIDKKWENYSNQISEINNKTLANNRNLNTWDISTSVGATGSKFISEDLKEELLDKNLELYDAYQEDYDYNNKLADAQSGWEQTGRMLTGIVAKGALVVIENTGYMLDVAQWTGLSDDIDGEYSNWASELAKDGIEAFDKNNPIYSKGMFDAGWFASGIQSVGASALGFAIPGGLAGKGIGLLASKVGQLVNGSLLASQGVAKFATAALTNYAESMSMAPDIYKEIYDSAIANGVSKDLAKDQATKRTKQFMWGNKINILTDAVALGHMTRAKDIVSGGAKLTRKEMVKSGLKQMKTEAWEEYNQDLMSSEAIRSGKMDLGLIEDDDSSFLGRALEFAGSDEGLSSMIWGAVGGPAQSVGSKYVKEGTGKAAEKLGLSGVQKPKPITKVPPTSPENERPVKPKEPETYKEFLQRTRRHWDNDKLENVADPNNSLSDPVSEAEYAAEYKRQSEEYEKSKDPAWEKYDKEMEEYSKSQEEYDKKLKKYNDWLEQKAEFEEFGTVAQTKKELSAFLEKENELLLKYKKAVEEGDNVTVTDIENERFDTLFTRYARRKAVAGSEGSLEKQLEAIIEDKGSTPETKQMAQKYLKDLPQMISDYGKIYNKYENYGATDVAFMVKQRAKRTNELLDLNNDEIQKTSNVLNNNLAKTQIDGATAIDTELALVSLELDALSKKAKKLSKTLSIQVEADVEQRIKALQTKKENLTKAAKEQEGGLSQNTINSQPEIEDLKKLMDNKAQLYITNDIYKHTDKLYNDSKYRKDVKKQMNEIFDDAINSATSKEQIDMILAQMGNADFGFFERKRILNAIKNKEIEIERKAQAREELITKKKQAFTAYKNQLDKYKQLFKSENSRIAGLTRRSNVLSNRKKELEEKLGINTGIYSADVELERELEEVNDQLDIVQEKINTAKTTRSALRDNINEFSNAEFDRKIKEDLETTAKEKRAAAEKLRVLEERKTLKQEEEQQEEQEQQDWEIISIEQPEIEDRKETENPLAIRPDEAPPEDAMMFQDQAPPENPIFQEPDTDPWATDPTREADVIDIVNNLNTVAAQEESDEDTEKEPVIDVDNDASINSVSNEENEHQSKEFENNISTVAYISPTAGWTMQDTGLANWLETTPEQNKVGLTFEFVIDEADLENEFIRIDAPTQIKILSKFIKGNRNFENLTKEELDFLPIRMYVLGRDGKRITDSNGDYVYGWYRVANDIKYGDLQAAELRQTRDMIFSSIKRGIALRPKIEKVGKGFLITGENNNPLDVFPNGGKDTQLMMSDGQFLYAYKNGKTTNRVTDVPYAGGNKGFIFAKMKSPDGKWFPLKLNTRRLNQTEQNTIYQMLLKIAEVGDINAEVDLEGFSGLTYKEALDLLVYQSWKGKTPFNIEMKGPGNGIIKFGKRRIHVSELATQEQAILKHLGSMWRTTRSDMINRPMDKLFSNDITWFGKEVNTDQSYNTFMYEEGALTTNAAFINDRLFVQPPLYLSAPNTWGSVKQVSDEELASQKLEQERTKAAEKVIENIANEKKIEEDFFTKQLEQDASVIPDTLVVDPEVDEDVPLLPSMFASTKLDKTEAELLKSQTTESQQKPIEKTDSTKDPKDMEGSELANWLSEEIVKSFEDIRTRSGKTLSSLEWTEELWNKKSVSLRETILTCN